MHENRLRETRSIGLEWTRETSLSLEPPWEPATFTMPKSARARPLLLVVDDEIPVLNVIERACTLADGTLISGRELASAFPPEVIPGVPGVGRSRGADSASARGGDCTAPLQQIERDHTVDVLRRVNGNRMAAARLLGISRRALYRRLERHHIDDEPARMSARRNCS